VARRSERLEAAFAREEERAQRAAAAPLLAAVGIITVWVTIENGFPLSFFYYPFMAGFALIGVAGVLLRRWNMQPWWERYARFAAGILLLITLVLLPNPYFGTVETPAMKLRWQNELYLYVLIAASVFTYSPRVVLWTGLVAAIAWTGSGLWVLTLPTTSHGIAPDLWATMTIEERRFALMDPNRVFVNGLVRNAIALLLVSGTLALFVRRSREIVLRHADAERQRDNLSRYFSANLVDELADADASLTATRRQDAAVLFADMRGFTALSAEAPPEDVIETLRQFHRRTEAAVFAHDGTLEKFIGDGVMATFGTPKRGPEDASNALRSAAALLHAVDSWNAERIARGQPRVGIGIGIHYGPVVLGDIGGEHRLEFAVVGDTVNVASRLERLTRELDALAVASDEVVAAATAEGSRPADLLPGLIDIGMRAVRGRAQPLRLWVRAAPATPRPGGP